jgi:hypothetical protein
LNEAGHSGGARGVATQPQGQRKNQRRTVPKRESDQSVTKARRQSKMHIDKEKYQIQKDAERIIHSGTLDEFKEMLRSAGIDPESAKGKGFIDRLIRLGASGRSPQ